MSTLTTTFDRQALEVGSYYQEWKPFDKRPGYTQSFVDVRKKLGEGSFTFVVEPKPNVTTSSLALTISKLVSGVRVETVYPTVYNQLKTPHVLVTGKECDKGAAWTDLYSLTELVASIDGTAVVPRRPQVKRSVATGAALRS